MILDKDQTKITIEEQVVTNATFYGFDTIGGYWVADLDGTGVDGETVRMSRSGKSPDDALRILFEAMHAARVTL